MDNRSPEEKLLGLIRNDGSRKAGASSGSGGPRASFGARFFPFGRLAGPRPSGSLLRRLRIFLFALACSSFVAVLGRSYYLGRHDVPMPAAQTLTYSVEKAGADPQKPSLDAYVKKVQDHPIFGGTTETVSTPAPAHVVSGMEGALELVGVILDADPQAIVKDKKTNQIFYLRKGQVWNDFTVGDVQEGKLVLERAGKLFEYHL